MEPLTIAGVMSGTSGDGIDVAVTTITPSPDDSQTPPGVELKGSVTVPFAAETRALLNELCSVKDASALPNEKYDLPETSAQECGFRYEPFVKVNPMFHKPRGSCEITRYADAYYETTGVTPFHRRTAQPKRD